MYQHKWGILEGRGTFSVSENCTCVFNSHLFPCSHAHVGVNGAGSQRQLHWLLPNGHPAVQFLGRRPDALLPLSHGCLEGRAEAYFRGVRLQEDLLLFMHQLGESSIFFCSRFLLLTCIVCLKKKKKINSCEWVFWFKIRKCFGSPVKNEQLVLLLFWVVFWLLLFFKLIRNCFALILMCCLLPFLSSSRDYVSILGYLCA